jgi:hypothetical protein
MTAMYWYLRMRLRRVENTRIKLDLKCTAPHDPFSSDPCTRSLFPEEPGLGCGLNVVNSSSSSSYCSIQELLVTRLSAQLLSQAVAVAAAVFAQTCDTYR